MSALNIKRFFIRKVSIFDLIISKDMYFSVFYQLEIAVILYLTLADNIVLIY